MGLHRSLKVSSVGMVQSEEGFGTAQSSRFDPIARTMKSVGLFVGTSSLVETVLKQLLKKSMKIDLQ